MTTFFDILIALCIISTAAPAVILLWHRYQHDECWESRHPHLSGIGASILLFLTAIILYGSFLEPRLLVVTEQTIRLPSISKPIRIVLVSDFQVGPVVQTAFMEKIVERILSLHPDMVLIAGDNIDNSEPLVDETVYLAPLQKLTKLIPTYAVNGNHEYGVAKSEIEKGHISLLPDLSEQTEHAMIALGVQYLTNDIVMVTSTPSPLYLFGGDSLAAGKLSYEALETRTSSTLPTIMLVHTPEASFQASTYRIDLLLAGHTHGGQIRLPFIGPVGRVEKEIPVAWYQGLNMYNGMQLYVTSGTGETGTRARLFNPPEIVLLTIE